MLAPTTLPTISVIIPTYNGEKWISATLDSVFRQTQLPNEIVVVDDASSDTTAGRVLDFADNASIPVHLIRCGTNSGSPAATINKGIARASGDLIAVLDQDDVFLPSKLALQARVLAGNPGLAFVFSLYRRNNRYGAMWDLPGTRLRVRHFRRLMTSCDGFLRCKGSVGLQALTCSATNFFGGFPGFMFRRKAWEQKAGLDESLLIGADFEFLCWLCTQGDVALIPEIMYQRQEHGGNISRSAGIRGHIDVVKVLLRYADFSASPAASLAFRTAINRHLWNIARRLASAGHRHSARKVGATAAAMMNDRIRVTAQRLAIPAYVGYYRLIGRPWQVSAEQAAEASTLAETAVRQLVQ